MSKKKIKGMGMQICGKAANLMLNAEKKSESN